MTTLDALEAVALAAGTLHVNAAPLPPGSYAVTELDWRELGQALTELYKARKAERDARRLAERDAATQLSLVT